MLYEEIELYLNCDMLKLDLSSLHRAKLELQNDELRIDIKNLKRQAMHEFLGGINMKQIFSDFILNISALSLLAFIVFPMLVVGFISGLILKIMPKKGKEYKGVLRVK